MIIAVMDEKAAGAPMHWPAHANRQAFLQKINKASRQAEKTPCQTEAHWLSSGTLLVSRFGILVGVEKALIENSFSEKLKLAKRPLERRILTKARLETVIRQPIKEIFFDWNFEGDAGLIVFLLEPSSSRQTAVSPF